MYEFLDKMWIFAPVCKQNWLIFENNFHEFLKIESVSGFPRKGDSHGSRIYSSGNNAECKSRIVQPAFGYYNPCTDDETLSNSGEDFPKNFQGFLRDKGKLMWKS